MRTYRLVQLVQRGCGWRTLGDTRALHVELGTEP